jgi:hypothetical protein
MSEETTPTATPTATATPATDAPNIKFGFAVLVDVDGNVFVERTKDAFALPIERDASLLEVRRYTSEILMDLQAQSAAEYVTLRLSGIGKAAVVDEATPSA